MELDDASIMRCVQRGQPELFEVLVRRYRDGLVQVAFSRLGDQALAEDVVQEAFLAAYSARETYRPEFAFRTWLWTILLNLCSKSWKRRQARREEPGVVESASVETGLSVALLTERREQVQALLERLPDVQADALRLRFFGGLQFPEIAAVMQSSLGAAKMRVKNGLRTLSDALQAEGRGHDL